MIYNRSTDTQWHSWPKGYQQSPRDDGSVLVFDRPAFRLRDHIAGTALLLVLCGLLWGLAVVL